VGQVQIALETFSLRALAGTGRTKKDQASYRRNPSYERIIS
jgi:hypothetical protein